ncbi:ketoacyl-ACP synthase III family protein [Rhodococcus jostii]|uniref:Ketoacyl-ACP synthase III family protein n=1 Tax=Rhodococcus jostii TaxID=132919 RepID=A0ABU4CTI3_RHOJO|nr:ketoacyl-ACP synthase III family protein [Rhodococcus jostii]MDV6286788.1 ketoacyl-ACP synthase III family protein [Rhodococcus jostii]
MAKDEIYIRGVGTELQRLQLVSEAVAAGDCPQTIAERAHTESVSVSDHASGAELAALAARTALRDAGVDGAEIDLIAHANVYYQGHDLWSPSSYIQREVGAGDAVAVEIRQMSNGGMASIDLAAAYLLGRDRDLALLTTGDRFAAPGFDRWVSDPGTIYGDGGTALILSRTSGFAVLRSFVNIADATLEAMHRGEDPFGGAPFSIRPRVDLEPLKKDFLDGASVLAIVEKVRRGQEQVIARSLDEAGVKITDIAWFVLPHFGRRRLSGSFLRPLDIDIDSTTWNFARTVGHLGAGDQFAGLTYLRQHNALRRGDAVLLAGVGAGFTWSAAVVEIL